MNEDWADGEDNDNDGLVDEDDWDAVLVGLTDPMTGLPLPDPTGALFNRGIAAVGLDNVHLTDLKFSGLRRGVAFADHKVKPGAWVWARPFFCTLRPQHAIDGTQTWAPRRLVLETAS